MVRQFFVGLFSFIALLALWAFAMNAEITWPHLNLLGMFLGLIPGAVVGVPLVLFLVFAYLVSRLTAGPLGVMVYLAVVVVGLLALFLLGWIMTLIASIPVAIVVLSARVMAIGRAPFAW